MPGTLIVALDVDSRPEAEALVQRLGDAVDFYKIGYQLFYGGDGLALGKDLARRGKRVSVRIRSGAENSTLDSASAPSAAVVTL